jgi:hypothetical protein
VPKAFYAHVDAGDADAALRSIEGFPRLSYIHIPQEGRFDVTDFEQHLRAIIDGRRAKNPTPPESPGPNDTGNISDAAQVVAAMRAPFRACCQKGLDRDTNQSGFIRLVIDVDKDGIVPRVGGLSVGLDEQVVKCVMARAGSGRFPPPDGGSATVLVPVTFVKR